MPYVMVPVPEEHVEEAMTAVLRMTRRASITDWDRDSIASLFQSVDEAAKSVLSAVSRAMKVRKQVPDSEVAKSIELSQREILGIVRELNEQASDGDHPQLVGVQMATENLPNGRTREQRVLTMQPPVAEFIGEAEQAERQAAPHPLVGGAE